MEDTPLSRLSKQLRAVSAVITSNAEEFGRNLAALKNDLGNRMYDISLMLAAENRVASLSKREVVDALRPTIKQLVEMDPRPAREAYVEFFDEAFILLGAGYEPEEVIECFDRKLYCAKTWTRRGENEPSRTPESIRNDCEIQG